MMQFFSDRNYKQYISWSETLMQERQRSLSVKPQRLSISLAIAKTSPLKESQPILEIPNVRQIRKMAVEVIA
jgi:hypothetical protein